MAIQTTLADLRTRLAQRFDLGQSQYLSTTELNSLINEAGAHLHNWIVNSAEYYIWKVYPITVATTQQDYPLPYDFFKDLKIFATFANLNAPGQQYYQPVPRIMPQEYRGGLSTYVRGPWLAPFGYMILGQTLRISPIPISFSFNLEMWYTPHYTPLVNDTVVMDVSVAPGWD